MKYTVVAYAESGLPRKETTITARNTEDPEKQWGRYQLNV